MELRLLLLKDLYDLVAFRQVAEVDLDDLLNIRLSTLIP